MEPFETGLINFQKTAGRPRRRPFNIQHPDMPGTPAYKSTNIATGAVLTPPHGLLPNPDFLKQITQPAASISTHPRRFARTPADTTMPFLHWHLLSAVGKQIDGTSLTIPDCFAPAQLDWTLAAGAVGIRALQ
jgi:hypothetical protein